MSDESDITNHDTAKNNMKQNTHTHTQKHMKKAGGISKANITHKAKSGVRKLKVVSDVLDEGSDINTVVQ